MLEALTQMATLSFSLMLGKLPPVLADLVYNSVFWVEIRELDFAAMINFLY